RVSSDLECPVRRRAAARILITILPSARLLPPFIQGPTMSHQILVVSPNDNDLADTLRVLASAGYRASGATTFEEAKELLAIGSPDLVIADERLGAYNGLHVILRARPAPPHVRAIETSTCSAPPLDPAAP